LLAGSAVQRPVVATVVFVALLAVAIAAHPAGAALQSTIRADGGITISYPVGWQAVSADNGRTIVVAGPRAQGVRPAVTIVPTQGDRDPTTLLKSATAGLGTKAPIVVLNEQQVASGRRARYYVRGKGAAAEYVMVGVAEGSGWIATVVAIDLVSDPELRTRAEIFQAILAGIAMPHGRHS